MCPRVQPMVYSFRCWMLCVSLHLTTSPGLKTGIRQLSINHLSDVCGISNVITASGFPYSDSKTTNLGWLLHEPKRLLLLWLLWLWWLWLWLLLLMLLLLFCCSNALWMRRLTDIFIWPPGRVQGLPSCYYHLLQGYNSVQSYLLHRPCVVH